MILRNRGNGRPVFLFGQDNSIKVYDFFSSRFNREHLKYSRLLSFRHQKKEYTVGDFVSIHDDEENVYQIQAIGYMKNKTLHPELRFVAVVFVKADLFYKKNPRMRNRGRPKRNEYIQLDETKKLKPANIEKKMNMISFAENKEDTLVCRYSLKDDSLQDYVPMRVKFYDDFIEHGK